MDLYCYKIYQTLSRNFLRYFLVVCFFALIFLYIFLISILQNQRIAKEDKKLGNKWHLHTSFNYSLDFKVFVNIYR